jgi:hypothetical protein
MGALKLNSMRVKVLQEESVSDVKSDFIREG